MSKRTSAPESASFAALVHRPSSAVIVNVSSVQVRADGRESSLYPVGNSAALAGVAVPTACAVHSNWHELGAVGIDAFGQLITPSACETLVLGVSE